MRYNKQKSQDEESQIDLEISSGHAYLDLAHALRSTRNEVQEIEIRKTMDELVEASKYLREVLLRHADPHAFLASRCQLQEVCGKSVCTY